MANIRVTSPLPVFDGQPLTFKSPASCAEITGLIVYYPEGDSTASETFQFADAHGNNVGGKDLFAPNVIVKVILDTELSRAYIQNADTNAYLENKFSTHMAYAKKVGSPHNLLDNSNFRNPVNRNGQTVYKGAVEGIDKWSCTSNNWMVTVEDGCIMVSDNPDSSSTSTAMVRQTITVPPTLRGKTVTLAARLKGEDVRLNINNKDIGAYAGDDDWYVKVVTGTVPADAETIFVALQSRNMVTWYCEWVALYEGEYTADTLPEYQTKGYNVELLNCGGIVSASNPNLLDNWYFADPINQRGGYVALPNTPYYVSGGSTPAGTTTGYVAATYNSSSTYSIVVGGTTYYVPAAYVVRGYVGTGYGIDRWKTTSSVATVVLNAGGITVNLPAQYVNFMQMVENTEQYRGKTLTFSTLFNEVEVSGGYNLVLRVGTSSGQYQLKTISNTGLYSVTLTIPDDATLLEVLVQSRIASAGNINIRAAKLELGSVQTLAHQDADGNWVLNDPPPDKGMELIKCCMSTADSTDTYANNEVTPKAINAVNKAGDTMSGALTARQRLYAEFPDVVKAGVEAHSSGAVDIQRLRTDGKYAAIRLWDEDGTGATPHFCGNDTGAWYQYNMLHTGNKDLISPADIGAASTVTYTATVTTAWSEASTGHYFQDIAVNGMLATDNPIVDAYHGNDNAANELYNENMCKVIQIITFDGKIRVWVPEAISSAFPIQLKVVR